MAYSTIGPYGQGIWLIAKNGAGAFVNQNNLPAEGQGFEYYYLGSTAKAADQRYVDALLKLKVNVDPVAQGQSTLNALNQAFRTGKEGVPGPLGGLAALLRGVDIIPIPGIPGLGAAGEGATATEGAAAGGTGAAGGAGGAASALKSAASNLSNVTKAIGGAEVAAKIWEWLTTPGNWVRLLEYIGGAALIFFGVRQLAEAK